MKRFFSVVIAIILVFSSLSTTHAISEVPDKKAVLSALFEADINTIREAIDKRVVSCEELTSYYLDRIEKYNSSYNCFITLCEDALEVAKERDVALLNGDNKGSLFGVPVVIKDNMDLKDYYTTNGHHLKDSEIAKQNAKVVDLLLEQGAVIIGKTNMSTDAQDARTSYSKIKGETKNAYNTLLSAGGSSGGTAAAVSLNFAVAGLGTDTNSSLRIPAILNGCVSLRTTLKQISFDGCTHLNNSRDVIGAVTRTVCDQAIMLDVLTENKYSYEHNLDDNAIKNLKFGILSELTYPVDTAVITEEDKDLRDKKIKQFDLQYRTEENIDKEVKTAFETAVKQLTVCGAEVVTVSMPNLFESAYPTFAKHEFSIKKAFYNEIKAFMEQNDLDAIIFPTYLSTPLKTGADNMGKKWNVWSQVFLNNCRVISPSTGMPEISLLIGNHSSGAGIGMEILADKNCEQLLLNIAYTYSQKYDCRKSPAGAPDLYLKWNTGNLCEINAKYETSIFSDTVTEDVNTDNFTEITKPSKPDETISHVTNASGDTPQEKPSPNPTVIIATILLTAGVITFIIIKKVKNKPE